MKKKLLAVMLAAVSAMTLFVGCRKEEKQEPVIFATASVINESSPDYEGIINAVAKYYKCDVTEIKAVHIEKALESTCHDINDGYTHVDYMDVWYVHCLAGKYLTPASFMVAKMNGMYGASFL